MFSGLLVVELASVLAGPSVGQFFAELGAKVIKVENLKTKGDVTRTWKLSDEEDGDISAYFSSVNWGKKSIGVDIGKEEGRDIVYRLVKQADVVIASYKPGDAIKLGMDYYSLKAINPGLIYGMITGYGNDNPKVGYDAVIQAEAGFMYINGEPDGKSLKMPVALMDVLAAHHLKEGILVAMINKLKTGKGDCVEVSLLESAISSLVNQATNYLVAGSIPQKQGSKHPNIAPYGEVLQTKDGHSVILAVGNDRQFEELCGVLALITIVSDVRFQSNVLRVQNRGQLSQLLQKAFFAYNSDQIISNLNDANVPCGVIRNMEEVFKTKEAQKVLLHSADGTNSITGIRNLTASFGSTEKPSHFTPPPAFGEHTTEVILEFAHVSQSKIDELRTSEVIL